MGPALLPPEGRGMLERLDHRNAHAHDCRPRLSLLWPFWALCPSQDCSVTEQKPLLFTQEML